MNFCGLRENTISTLCKQKKRQSRSTSKSRHNSWSSCGRRLRGPRWLGDWFVNFQCWKPRMLGADLVTQMHGEHPTNWRIDSKCQIVSPETTERPPSRWKICLKDVRVVGAPGHIFYDACRLHFKKAFKKKTCFIVPEKVFFIALLKVRRVYVDAGVQEQLVVYLMTSRKPRVFWLVFQRHPLHTPETLLRILFLTNVWWETHLIIFVTCDSESISTKGPGRFLFLLRIIC